MSSVMAPYQNKKWEWALISVLNFQNGGLGPIDNFGYNMAKQGVVALTKGFKNSEPNVYDQENIKCYGLCPWYADTKLVRLELPIVID